MTRLALWILGLLTGVAAAAQPVWVARPNDPWLTTSRNSLAWEGTASTGLRQFAANVPAYAMRPSIGAVELVKGDDALTLITVSPDRHLAAPIVSFSASPAQIHALDPSQVANEAAATLILNLANTSPFQEFAATLVGEVNDTLRTIEVSAVSGDYLLVPVGIVKGTTMTVNGTSLTSALFRGKWNGTTYADWEWCKLGTTNFTTPHGQLWIFPNQDTTSPYVVAGHYVGLDENVEGGGGIYLSEDYGATWTCINTTWSAAEAAGMNAADIQKHAHWVAVNSDATKIAVTWGDPVLLGAPMWEAATLYTRTESGPWTKTVLAYDGMLANFVWVGDKILTAQHGSTNGLGTFANRVYHISTIAPYTIETYLPYVYQDITKNPDHASDKWGPYEFGNPTEAAAGIELKYYGGLYWYACTIYATGDTSAYKGLNQRGLYASLDGRDWVHVVRPDNNNDKGLRSFRGGAGGFLYGIYVLYDGAVKTYIARVRVPSVAARPAWTVSRAVTNLFDVADAPDLSSLEDVSTVISASTYAVSAGHANHHYLGTQAFHGSKSLGFKPDVPTDKTQNIAVYAVAAGTTFASTTPPNIKYSAWAKMLPRGDDYRGLQGWAMRFMPRHQTDHYSWTTSTGGYRVLIDGYNWSPVIKNMYSILENDGWNGQLFDYYWRGRRSMYTGTFADSGDKTSLLLTDGLADDWPTSAGAISGGSHRVWFWSADGTTFKAERTPNAYTGTGSAPNYQVGWASAYTAAAGDRWYVYYATDGRLSREARAATDIVMDAMQVTISDRYYTLSEPYTTAAVTRAAEYLTAPMVGIGTAWTVTLEWLPMEGWAMSITDDSALAGGDIPIFSIVAVDGSFINCVYDVSEKKFTLVDDDGHTEAYGPVEFYHHDRLRFTMTSDGTETYFYIHNASTDWSGQALDGANPVNVTAKPVYMLVGTLNTLAEVGYGRFIGPAIYDSVLETTPLIETIASPIATRGTAQRAVGTGWIEW